MKNLIFIFCIALLSSCIDKIKDIKTTELTGNERLVLVSQDIIFDSERSDCFLRLAGHDLGTASKTIAKDTLKENVIHIIQIPNKVEQNITEISCLEYNFLYNKVRRKNINPPLKFRAAEGDITYAGTIVADWESEGFGFADILNGGGAISEDEGSLVLKREDRSAEIISKLNKDNPKLLKKFRFRSTAFEENNNIIQ